MDAEQGNNRIRAQLPMAEFWQNKRVLVTGGAGFLGSFVVGKLKERGCRNIFIPKIQDYNLVEME